MTAIGPTLSEAWSSAVSYATGRTPQTFARALLATMLILDGLLILAHIATGGLRVAFEIQFTETLHHYFSIFHDDGIPEHFNFVKWTMAGIFTIAAAYFGRSKASVWMVPMVAFFLLDDAGSIHERAGDWLAEMVFEERYGGLTNMIGEIAVLAALALVQIALLVFAFRAASVTERPILVGIALVIAGLAVFGVLVDAIHTASVHYMSGLLVDQALGILEDGAELFLITMLCLCAFRLLQVSLDRSHV